ncbi:IS21 family transposase [Paraburkholderia nemoris]|jgi:transposase|uniref:IS21 family transposase n=2 Tax=Burkholderiaceae TaxID=119060 RepID=UPI00190C07ED|nr:MULTISPECIES: IS21 family transposase [Paraburkholderia]MBK3787227.1 IS21 family transposase [Paraburkholderia aspalathi]USU14635.1 IS21 family transposase [Paraburkholderia fungorum]USU22583.1 IS21 family transposase [Paraburkholderia fungorum]
MAYPKLTMRKIREVLRLHFESGFNHREIARALGASPTTVGQYVRRMQRAGLSYPLPTTLSDDELEALLYPPPPRVEGQRPEPDWPTVRRELSRKGVTLDLLWNEYKAEHPDGYAYTWFCTHYNRWASALPLTLRQTHAPGEKLFVDYSGDRIAIIDAQTGEIRDAELFVAVLGASNYTYAEATWTQQLPDWIGSHVRTFEFIGGCTEIVVPDNLKSGVHKPSFYDPIVNRAYGAMASHYSVAVIPARSKKPRDKAKVEQGVLLVQRWILARLRKQRFFSLAEANRAIAALLVSLNDKAFKKLPGSRRTAFEELERAALKPLPAHPYQYADWKVARVGIDYHIELVGHYYSVPHRFAREQVDVRYTTATVEVFHRGTRIAAHAKSDRRGAHTTLTEHMPANHQAVTGWDPQRLRNWAATIGPHTDAVIQHLLGGRQHPQQAYRTCLGVLRLAKDYGNQRLEAACSRAIDLKAPSYRFIDSTLKNGLDQQPSPVAVQPDLPLAHANVRGPDYYH